MNALEIVNKFNASVVDEQGEGLADLITDDIVFDGPFLKTSGAKNFIRDYQIFIQAKKSYTMLKQFADGKDVCSIYIMDMETPQGVVACHIADWMEIHEDKIAKITIYFDPRALAKALGRQENQ